MNMTVAEFCDKHGACDPGRDWALSTGEPDMAALWKRNDIQPPWRIWIATRIEVLDDRTLRLFACWCVRQIWHLLSEHSRRAIEVSERAANGEETTEEFTVAMPRAMDHTAASDWAVYWAADLSGDMSWAWSAAMASTCAVEAAVVAGRSASRDAVLAAQADWLIANTTPNFECKPSGTYAG